ncbi:MAG: hypothetical protein K8R69_10145 [Deltaproteobacteria bacterium]|nr:hypothetical protein [Deltaproteobacteria bacterium]
MAEQYSDILILGTDLAGLITGAFLAKRGLAVTVLNFEKDVSLEKKNIQPNLITHLESRLFKNILGRLSILDHELNILSRLEVPYQTVLPKHRIDVYRDREKLYRELKREFPQDFENVKAFYETMDNFDATLDSEKLQELILPKGLRAGWRFKKFVKETGLNQRVSDLVARLGADREVQSFLESQLKLLSKTHSANPFTYQITKSLSNENCILFEVKGGIGHLKKLFLDKIEAYNGRIKNETHIEKIVFEKRRVKGVQLGGFEGMIGCRYLLWNDEIRGLLNYLPKKWRTRKLRRNIEAVTPRYYHFSIQYQLDPEVIPVGMRENLILIGDPQEELTGTNYLHLNTYHPAQNDPQGQAFLTVSYLLNADKLHEPSSYFDGLHADITQRLKKLMPFSDGKVRLHFPLENKASENPEMLFPMEKSDFEIFRENATANPIYEVHPNEFGGLFPLSHRTPYKNLLLTSPEILAALGFEGKFLLGLKTIDMIWNEVEVGHKKAIKQRKVE